MTAAGTTAQGREVTPAPAVQGSSNPRPHRIAAARALLERARTEQFAVGAFNADNLTTMRAIARAARATAAPVLVELSQAEVEAIGLANARDFLDNEIEALGIEAYLNLDHAPDAERVEAAIDAGFEFVHVDVFQSGPRISEARVIEETRQVVAYARRTGAIVEGEQKYFAGSSTLHRHTPDAAAIAASLSTPAGARRFVEATEVDILAVGISNLHGRYPQPKRLDLSLLARIRSQVDVPFSLHGASGTPRSMYSAVARVGITKININSDIRYAYRRALENEFRAHPNEYATAKLIGPVMDAVQSVVEDKIRAFGSAGKASAGALR
jgi:fructose-bisphosphate aldolase class II